jgi:hypothetical protein
MVTSSLRELSMRHTKMSWRARVAVPAVLAIILAGCDLPALGGCDHWERPAIQVEVRDATTGRPAANGAFGWVQDGRFMDSLRVVINHYEPDEALQMRGAPDRPGTYHVVIQKPGYVTWERRNVRARASGCSVDTERLTASLQPLP